MTIVGFASRIDVDGRKVLTEYPSLIEDFALYIFATRCITRYVALRIDLIRWDILVATGLDKALRHGSVRKRMKLHSLI